MERILLDNQLTPGDLEYLISINQSYKPDFSYPDNKTIVFKNGYLLQLRVFLTQLDVVVPYEDFTGYNELLEYISSTIKNLCPTVTLANALNFTVNFYTKKSWMHFDYEYQVNNGVQKTLLGKNLSSPCTHAKVILQFEEGFKIKKKEIKNSWMAVESGMATNMKNSIFAGLNSSPLSKPLSNSKTFSFCNTEW